MRTLHTEIDIAAPPETVWRHLMDFAAYPQWNPFVVAVKGDTAKGSRLKVRLKTGKKKGRAITLSARVTRHEPGRSFAWRGSLPGLFTGEHQFLLESPRAGVTRLVHREDFTGLLVPLVWGPFIDRGARGGFEAMNHALKERAEKG